MKGIPALTAFVWVPVLLLLLLLLLLRLLLHVLQRPFYATSDILVEQHILRAGIPDIVK